MTKKLSDSIEISVVIPMFNSEKTIIDTIQSIENQTDKNHIKEILIVNDGSTDKSKELVEKHSKESCLNIKLIDKKNGGVSSARNMGMKSSSGNWIAFCDSDDRWLPKKLEIQLDIIKNYDIDFLSCNMNDKPLKILFKKITKLYSPSISDICIKSISQPSTVIMRKSIFDEIGGFDENQRYAEDGNYFLKIAHDYKYYHLPEQVIDYGYGKRGFGEWGLSANLKGMHEGNLKNLNELKENKWISNCFYYCIKSFYYLKYVRRIIISRLKRN